MLENFAHTLQRVLPKSQVKHVVTTQIGDLFPLHKAVLTNLVVKYVKRMVPRWQIRNAIPFKAALRQGRGQSPSPVKLRQQDIAFLQYTGGTTGVAKGAVLTHGNLVANLQQVSAWIGRDLDEGKELAVIPLPLYHVYALTCNLVFMKIGARVTLITNPRDLPAFINELKKHPFTVIIGVNTLFNALLNAPAFRLVDYALTEACNGRRHGRAARRRRQVEGGHRRAAGRGLWAHRDIARCDLANALNIKNWTGTIGLPIPSTDAAILDERRQRSGGRTVGRDLHSRAAGDEGVLEKARRNREGVRARTDGSAPATWASWTPTATSRSPIARRT